MSVVDYFKRVTTMTAEEVREFLKSTDPAEYNLVDVRQPREYERGHLPGAQLMPLSELLARTGELDPYKPTITY
jgi:rhodanese-related sulfurtransferase